MILETALADALYLNWTVPLATLPPAPSGLRYEGARVAPAAARSLAFFSLVLFRQVGLHLRGASWLAISYPQVNARLYVRDAANAASVLLLRQLVPGWVVPIGRLIGGQPFSAAACEFPDGLPRGVPERVPEEAVEDPREWRWKFSAGARFRAAVRVGAPVGTANRKFGRSADWAEEVSFFRDRPRAYWRQGAALRRAETEHPAAAVLPVGARIEQSDWLDTFLPFAPVQGWSDLHSAFLVPSVQHVFAFDAARDIRVAAPVAAAG